jgi:hypothetical protein
MEQQTITSQKVSTNKEQEQRVNVEQFQQIPNGGPTSTNHQQRTGTRQITQNKCKSCNNKTATTTTTTKVSINNSVTVTKE